MIKKIYLVSTISLWITQTIQPVLPQLIEKCNNDEEEINLRASH
jgi:hypothetical protein